MVQTAAQDVESVQAAVLLAAVAVVVFWRPLIKYAIMAAAVAVIAALGYGAIVIWQDVHHVVG
jgi:hypothetical protein